MYRKQLRRRRAVVALLIVASLVLISISFSESESGPLHSLQRGLASVFAPIEEGTSRALKPARDMFNWFDETFDARGDVGALREENQVLRAELAKAQSAVGENETFREALNLDRSVELGGLEPVTARVIAKSATVWYSTVQIDKGSSASVGKNDPVITGAGLVGRIDEVTGGTAKVELITDPQSAVSAKVLPDGPQGVVAPEAGDPDDLLLDFIDEGEKVNEGEMLVTAGWSNGEISSAFPPNLRIGRVTRSIGAAAEAFQRIHVRPFADIRNLEYVQVLTGGPKRPGVPG